MTIIGLLVLLLILGAIYFINHAIPITPEWFKKIVDIVLGLIAIVQIIYFVYPFVAAALSLHH